LKALQAFFLAQVPISYNLYYTRTIKVPLKLPELILVEHCTGERGMTDASILSGKHVPLYIIKFRNPFQKSFY
jgi:hypothetical protein